MSGTRLLVQKTALESCHTAHLVSLFTLQALGSFYFLHESLKNIYQFDFKGKTPRCPLRPLGFSVLLDPARCRWSGFSRPLLPSVPATGLHVRSDRGFPRSQAGTRGGSCFVSSLKPRWSALPLWPGPHPCHPHGSGQGLWFSCNRVKRRRERFVSVCLSNVRK